MRNYFDDALPFYRFSVNVTCEDITRMQTILEAIPLERVTALQDGLASFHRWRARAPTRLRPHPPHDSARTPTHIRTRARAHPHALRYFS